MAPALGIVLVVTGALLIANGRYVAAAILFALALPVLVAAVARRTQGRDTDE